MAGKSRHSAKNQQDRLAECKRQMLTFMYNPLARMVKVRQKVSGSIRSMFIAASFCRIRGYISTAEKNVVSVIDAILGSFEGKPFMPPSITR